MYGIPSWVPEDLHEYYTPPGPDESEFFKTITVKHVRHDPLTGHPTGVPETITVYARSEEWAMPRVLADTRWAAMVKHEREPEPEYAPMPDWLEAAPITPEVRHMVRSAMQQDWLNRHQHPHRDRPYFLEALRKEAATMTESDVRRLWDERYGIPRAREARSRAEQLAAEATRAAAAEVALARREATAARQARHDELEQAARSRLEARAEQLEAEALAHLTRSN